MKNLSITICLPLHPLFILPGSHMKYLVFPLMQWWQTQEFENTWGTENLPCEMVWNPHAWHFLGRVLLLPVFPFPRKGWAKPRAEQELRLGKGKSGWHLGSWGKALWSAELEMRGYRAAWCEEWGSGGRRADIVREREGLLSRKERAYSTAKRIVCKSLH